MMYYFLEFCSAFYFRLLFSMINSITSLVPTPYNLRVFRIYTNTYNLSFGTSGLFGSIQYLEVCSMFGIDLSGIGLHIHVVHSCKDRNNTQLLETLIVDSPISMLGIFLFEPLFRLSMLLHHCQYEQNDLVKMQTILLERGEHLMTYIRCKHIYCQK